MPHFGCNEIAHLNPPQNNGQRKCFFPWQDQWSQLTRVTVGCEKIKFCKQKTIWPGTINSLAKNKQDKQQTMKIIKYKWIYLIGLGLAFLFGTINNTSAQSPYGQWQACHTFTGLDFRARKCEFNSDAKKWEWHVEFRNRYEKTINFSFKLDENGTTCSRLTDRTTLKAGEEGKNMGDNGTTWKLLISGDRIEVFIGDVRFGNDDTGPYAIHG